LLEREEQWAAPVAVELAHACAWRARDQAVRVLRRSGLAADAEALTDIETLVGVEGWAAAAAAEAEELPSHAAFAADAAALARAARPEAWRPGAAAAGNDRQSPAATAANLAFVVAHGAGLEAAGSGNASYAAGVEAERNWQIDWLHRRLELESL
jgi:hypothetical protein